MLMFFFSVFCFWLFISRLICKVGWCVWKFGISGMILCMLKFVDRVICKVFCSFSEFCVR